MEKPQITSAKQIKEILAPIPKELFQIYSYGKSLWGSNSGEEDNGKSCALGHIHRHFIPNDPRAVGDRAGYGARQLTKQYLEEKYGLEDVDISDVNNDPEINGYTEPEIKDRVMHLIDDMIKDGY